MKNGLVWVIIVLLAALAAWFFSIRQDQAEIDAVEVRQLPADPVVQPAQPQFPVEQIAPPPAAAPEPFAPVEPEAPPGPPLPTLAESDSEVLARAEAMLPDPALVDLLVPEFLLSRLVASVDGLDARRLPQPMRPIEPVPGRFEVLKADGSIVISPANSERYRPHLDALAGVDVESILPLYLRYYPLLQEAYLGLGYEDVYFNDRVIAILDHLLATPEPLGLVEVVQNEAVYEFLDPELEALSVGQKALLRLGAEDRAAVKLKLRRLRAALAGGDVAGD